MAEGYSLLLTTSPPQCPKLLASELQLAQHHQVCYTPFNTVEVGKLSATLQVDGGCIKYLCLLWGQQYYDDTYSREPSNHCYSSSSRLVRTAHITLPWVDSNTPGVTKETVSINLHNILNISIYNPCLENVLKLQNEDYKTNWEYILCIMNTQNSP